MRATKLREHLSRRPIYENEEEKEKIGGLRNCTWTTYHTPKLLGRRREADQVVVVLAYDRATYKFILCSNASRARAGTPVEIPLLLVKASAGITKLFNSFLAENFQVTVSPLKLPSAFLANSISTYVSALYGAFTTVSETISMLSLLKDTIGTLKLSIVVNMASPHGAEIAQHLKTMDIDVPGETLWQLLTAPPPESLSSGTKQSLFLASLRHHIHQRTGLILPLLPTDNASDETVEPPLKLSRISNTSFALSCEGRLKFSSKAFEAVEGLAGLESGDGNIVKKANAYLLDATIAEALKYG